MKRRSVEVAPSRRAWWSIEVAARHLGLPTAALHEAGVEGWGPRYTEVLGVRRYRPADVRAWYANSTFSAGRRGTGVGR